MGSRYAGLSSCDLVVVVRGLSSTVACGIFLDQGWNSCPMYCEADS